MLRNTAPRHCCFKQYRRRNPKLQAALRQISSSRIRSNYLLACNDARVIVKQLAAWSQLHKVKWQLEIASDRIGDVANGQASKPVQDFLVGLCKASKLQEPAIPGLLKKFESRKEPEPPLPQPKKRAWWKFWGNREA